MDLRVSLRVLMLTGSFMVALNASQAFAREEMPAASEHPAPKVVVTTMTDAENAGTIVVALPNMQVVIPAPVLEGRDAEVFNSMDDDYKQRFHNHRRQYLTWAAQMMSTAFVGSLFGSGAMVKDRIMWSWDHLKNVANAMARPAPRVITEEMYNKNPELYQEEEVATYMAPRVLKAFRERKAEVVERFLQNIDRALWKNPYLTASSNEMAIFVSGGVTGFGGVDIKKGRFKMTKGIGGSFEIGLMIGFNLTSKSTVVQIFRLTEKFKGTMTGISANLAFVPKAGFTVANMKTGTEMNADAGRVEYPPAPPGVSVYYAASPKRLTVGANPPVGLIPWPFDSVLLYSMDYVMKPMMRMNLRMNTLKDVIHVETGNMALPKKASKESVARVVDLVRSKASGRRLCMQVHAH